MTSLFNLKTSELPSGFRLQSLEVLNWGTFNGKVWKLTPEGDNFLLTGANGSGKSTLVDAVLTLLVPSNKRNYNIASGFESRRKDRSEKTYVEGHYGRETSGVEGILKVRKNQEDCYSVLSAVFSEPEKKVFVALAQVFWFQGGELNKFFLISDKPLSVRDSLLLNRRSIKNLKADLKNDGVRIFDNFKAYSAEFRNLVGLRSEKAIDLFNQIVGIKSLGVLNDFVREHMLERIDVRSKIEELDKSYSNLTEAYQAIVKAREQLKLLEPIGEKAGDLRQVRTKIKFAEKLLKSLVPYFSKLHLEILAKDEKEKELELSKIQDQLYSIRADVERLREEELKIAISLENNDTVRRIADLKKRIEDLQKEKSIRDQSWKQYSGLASRLNLPYERKETDFYEVFRLSGVRLEENESHKEILRTQITELEVENDNLKKRNRITEEEIAHLKRNKHLLHQDKVKIRNQISETLGISVQELPFVCELIQVKETERPWLGAIERLLHSFGLRMLVPEIHYIRITEYVNRTFLNSKFTYFRMLPVSGYSNESPANKNELFYKLEIKPELDSEKRRWIESQILRDYNYVCCDIDSFYNYDKAITTEGLIKTGKIRHEKDDRSKVSDGRNFILGWNNLEKIRALEEEFVETGKRIYELTPKLKEYRTQEDTNSQERSDLNRIREFNVFSKIDTEGIESDLQKSNAHLDELERSSEDYKKLKSQHDTVKKRLGESVLLEKEAEKTITVLEQRIAQIREKRSELLRTVSEYSLEELSDAFEEISERTLDETLTGENLYTIRKKLEGRMESEKTELVSEEAKIADALNKQLDKYVKKFSEDSERIGLVGNVDYIESFEEELEKIRKERLPEFENRFRTMMDDKVSKQIIEFKMGLEDDVLEIKERIQELNESLRWLDYVKDKTYIQLEFSDTKNKEIVGENGFKFLLKECIPNVGDGSSNEDKFQKIRELLDRLKVQDGNDRWSKSVTDTRNWLDFRVVEFDKETNKPKEVYDSSAGKSGGQTVKLAYTILASAIAYQFGFRNKKSFRFVVIDEMFNNLDNPNSKYAMDLFQQLGLQLLVVTPMDRIGVVEPYISSANFVSINSEGNGSSVVPITKEKLKNNKLENYVLENGNVLS
ncbi:hypothetical protein LEP1GSC060_2109 [Leptospira weilii serovar Ranarum str. ICFT]|uniref:AAA domain protein n=1 Tax=Leptospira weilii serovar Ranarum str. ICFT TaxID=1218598 RepID=N1WNR3_9LEPT|nr:ATP-binding protein [Leptospira weilii]EMY78789.1 hypothetical protein LEP1GSC060_2109 [Leptospira weilii serovar Ranarum str. ICFT]